MESASTSTALFDTHPLPHQQFSSRLAFVSNNSKLKLNSFISKKSARLPPIARCDSITSPENFEENLYESIESSEESTVGIDPNLRVKQLEKNLTFVKEHCQSILKCLHNELEDLKRKNRDLQFQLIISGSLSQQQTQALVKEQVLIMPIIRGCLPPQISEHITKLDKEVRRLRYALGETLKMNAILQNELQKLRKEIPNEKERQLMIELNNNSLSSPPIGNFSETLKQIYNSSKKTDRSAFSLPRITNSSSK